MGMRASTPVARDKLGHFLPGIGGNPNGRPPARFDLPAICRTHTPEAIERLVEIMRGEDDDRALRAIQMLLDRGWGRPMQQIEDSTQSGTRLTLMHLVATQRVAEQLQREWDASQHNGKTNGSGAIDARPVIDWSQPALE